MRTEAGLARLAIGVVALHVVDDNFLQPNPGTSAGDHLVGGLVPLALLVAAAAFYPRAPGRRPRDDRARSPASSASSSAPRPSTTRRAVGPSGDDFTGLLSIPAGLLLIGLGAVTLWRSRRRDDAPLVALLAPAAASPAARRRRQRRPLTVSVAYVVTHAARADVPAADLGAPYEDVEFTTSDGLTLKGWYIRSRNGAAVISFPGRAGSQKRAKMLADHGYGVLLFDRRGEGESEGDPNLFGWQGERDIHAAVAFLQRRPDVDPERIGGIGLSVGGEMMIEAAAESPALKAIVSEGASGRSVRDDRRQPRRGWQEVVGDGVTTAATALFTDDLPPADARRASSRRSPAPVFFVYGEEGQPAEKPANDGVLRGGARPEGDLGGARLRPHGGHRGAAAGVRAARRRLLRPQPLARGTAMKIDEDSARHRLRDPLADVSDREASRRSEEPPLHDPDECLHVHRLAAAGEAGAGHRRRRAPGSSR